MVIRSCSRSPSHWLVRASSIRRLRCKCGWEGSLRPAETNTEFNDRNCAEEFEDAFLLEWQVHVAPFAALSELDRLVAEHRELGDHIVEKVALAQSSGASWSEVGRAAGMSKQGAQQRWGSLHI